MLLWLNLVGVISFIALACANPSWLGDYPRCWTARGSLPDAEPLGFFAATAWSSQSLTVSAYGGAPEAEGSVTSTVRGIC